MWSGVDQLNAEGTQMEAPKAPTGVGSGEGAPQKNFGMFSLEMVHFDLFWNTF